jgi:hypothetical protein
MLFVQAYTAPRELIPGHVGIAYNPRNLIILSLSRAAPKAFRKPVI